MTIEQQLNNLKKGGVYGVRTQFRYEMAGPFISASGYLKLCRLEAISVPWGSLWGTTKVFRYWDNKHD